MPHGPEDEGIEVVDVIESLVENRGNRFIVNVENSGSIPNLPVDAIVEVPAVVDGYGVHTLAVGSLDRGLASQLSRHWAVQQLTVQAALSGDRRGRSRRSRWTPRRGDADARRDRAAARRPARGQRRVPSPVRVTSSRPRGCRRDRRCVSSEPILVHVMHHCAAPDPREGSGDERGGVRHRGDGSPPGQEPLQPVEHRVAAAERRLVGVLFLFPVGYAVYLGVHEPAAARAERPELLVHGPRQHQPDGTRPGLLARVRLTLIFVVASRASSRRPCSAWRSR